MAELLTPGEEKALKAARERIDQGEGLGALDTIIMLALIEKLLRLLQGGTGAPKGSGDRAEATL